MSRLRVLSYNIQYALGTDRRVDLGRIADVIAAAAPDVVALQEVDIDRPRTGSVDQPGELARRLGMAVAFTPCLERGAERYGLATLTALPILDERAIELPAQPALRRSRPRRALVTRLAWGERPLELVNTHFSVAGAERLAQADAIARELGAGDPGDPGDPGDQIVCGDLNCLPWSAPVRALCRTLRSATRGARTWPAFAPLFGVDHILVGGSLAVIEGGRWLARGARRASDHLPVVAVVERA